MVEPARLAAISLFAGLDEPDLAAVAAAAGEIEAAEGQVLVTEGDFGYVLYAIESGTAEVRRNGSLVGTLGPGDPFGEVAVIASARRTASVVAATPMRLITLFKRDVWKLEQNSPETADRLRALIAQRRAADLIEPL